MDHLDDIKFSHVKSVAIRIIITNSKVDRFHRIPSQGHRFILHCIFCDGSLSSNIIQSDGSIQSNTTNKIRLSRIVLDLQNRICAPIIRLDRKRAFIRPDLDILARGGELSLRVMMVNAGKNRFACEDVNRGKFGVSVAFKTIMESIIVDFII